MRLAPALLLRRLCGVPGLLPRFGCGLRPLPRRAVLALAVSSSSSASVASVCSVGGKPGFHHRHLSLGLLQCAASLLAQGPRPPALALLTWLQLLLASAGAERPSALQGAVSCSSDICSTSSCKRALLCVRLAARDRLAVAGTSWRGVRRALSALILSKASSTVSPCEGSGSRLGGFKMASHMSTGNREPSSLVSTPLQKSKAFPIARMRFFWSYSRAWHPEHPQPMSYIEPLMWDNLVGTPSDANQCANNHAMSTDLWPARSTEEEEPHCDVAPRRCSRGCRAGLLEQE